ncbi:MAG: lysostaphin resistance A-like protein [Jatrophihabitans sp.]|uniref:CPBP family intramembrane glutamic endopeptidase n=1 Tax=Jatrophihabitans sp. TaxID=1932789 RepID=UPI0039105B6D
MTADRRRRAVVTTTLVTGAVLLGFSLATPPGNSRFYLLTLAVALVWLVGGLVSGPLHLGRTASGAGRRPVLTPIALGVAVGVVFVLGALVVREVEPLRSSVAGVLAHARRGNLGLVALIALANGAAEEVFFRGALYTSIARRHAVAGSTAVYTLVTAATGEPMLVFAGLLMGTLFALQRRVTGGILAPLLTHLTWSLVVLFALPPVIGQ